MENIIVKLKLLAGLGGGILMWIFGAPDGFLYALIALVALDYISGVSAAFNEGALSSSQGVKGLVKKVGIFLVVAVGTILDRQIFNDAGLLRGAVISFFIANEALSITENAGRLGIPIPKRLLSALAQLKDADGDKDGDNQ